MPAFNNGDTLMKKICLLLVGVLCITMVVGCATTDQTSKVTSQSHSKKVEQLMTLSDGLAVVTFCKSPPSKYEAEVVFDWLSLQFGKEAPQYSNIMMARMATMLQDLKTNKNFDMRQCPDLVSSFKRLIGSLSSLVNAYK